MPPQKDVRKRIRYLGGDRINPRLIPRFPCSVPHHQERYLWHSALQEWASAQSRSCRLFNTRRFLSTAIISEPERYLRTYLTII
ncbi:MAG: hypothetical protein DSM106950_26690 [Stigonema ocellatum SAG 48.90 = DSM 106950]|nr:hypothetical protein [Stigonema ocellatum SAG 48.90 = DSM 106950]